MRFFLVLAMGMLTLPAYAADLVGKARVIDGDTIEIAGQRIRLFGIDAPEAGQGCSYRHELWDCGEQSAAFLMRLTINSEVRCSQRDVDRYKRVVAVCYVGDTDINRSMVREGWALAYTHYSTDYVQPELEAQMQKLGVWRGQIVPPWEYRRLSKGAK